MTESCGTSQREVKCFDLMFTADKERVINDPEDKQFVGSHGGVGRSYPYLLRA